jgi:hypothetical protein
VRRVLLVVGALGGHLPASDRAAVGLAVRRLGGRIEAWSLRDDEPARRYALAAGAASAGTLEGLDGLAFDVALVGAGGAHPWGDLLPATLAELGGAALVLDVLDVAAAPEGLVVTRDLGRGAREELVVAGPAVLAVSPEASAPFYVSRHRQAVVAPAATAAGRRGLGDPLAGAAGPWEPGRPPVRRGAATTGPAAPAHERRAALLDATAGARETGPDLVVADARTCALHLLRYLGHLGIIERGAGPAPPPPAPPAAPAPAAEPLRAAAGPDAARRAPGGDARASRGPRPLGSRGNAPRPRSPDGEEA